MSLNRLAVILRIFLLAHILGLVESWKPVGLGWSSSARQAEVILKKCVISAILVNPHVAWSLDNFFQADSVPLTFQYSNDFVDSPKPLKTHSFEVYLKSNKIKGYNVGLTVDPVRIKTIQDFSTAQGLADKVLATERAKEGVFDVQLIDIKESTMPIDGLVGGDAAPLTAYDIEYKVDSSRGLNHYSVKATVSDKKLFVFTAQCKESSFDDVRENTKQILESLVMKRH